MTCVGPAITESRAQVIEIASPNEDTEGYFGYAVSGVPDLDGDLNGDVIIGAYQENPDGSPENAGRAYRALHVLNTRPAIKYLAKVKREEDHASGHAAVGSLPPEKSA